jgi:hypoxanthine phosphoribosyltransferase
MSEVQLHDLTFVPFITDQEIEEAVTKLAAQIDEDYNGLNPLLLVVLNGAFIFAADLVREIGISSYQGTSSSGQIKETFLWNAPLKNRHVIIVEDIVDTGHTLHHLLQMIKEESPASVETACLLMKPDAYQYQTPLKYVGLSIPDKFVVGYGMDYEGLGRDLKSIYKKIG